MQRKWVITDEHKGMIVRDFLREVAGVSRRFLKALKVTDRGILVNNQEVDVRYTLRAMDVLLIQLPEETKGADLVPEYIPLHIVYEDEAIIVLNKQAGLITIPSRETRKGTLANGILYYYKQKSLPYTVHIVTRLDRDTSGLVLVAKHRYSHAKLAEIQKKNELNRMYNGVVLADQLSEEKTIEKSIGRAEDSIIKRVVREDGQHAVTTYKVTKRFGPFALLDIELETGRTHQIRVHLSHIGHPLIGDDLYGGPFCDCFTRQALHCRNLSFRHPFTNEELSFEADLPKDFCEFIQRNE